MEFEILDEAAASDILLGDRTDKGSELDSTRRAPQRRLAAKAPEHSHDAVVLGRLFGLAPPRACAQGVLTPRSACARSGHSFAPVINPRSREIARQVRQGKEGYDPNVDIYDRLYDPVQRKKRNDKQELLIERLKEQCPFKPVINPWKDGNKEAGTLEERINNMAAPRVKREPFATEPIRKLSKPMWCHVRGGPKPPKYRPAQDVDADFDCTFKPTVYALPKYIQELLAQRDPGGGGTRGGTHEILAGLSFLGINVDDDLAAEVTQAVEEASGVGGGESNDEDNEEVNQDGAAKWEAVQRVLLARGIELAQEHLDELGAMRGCSENLVAFAVHLQEKWNFVAAWCVLDVRQEGHITLPEFRPHANKLRFKGDCVAAFKELADGTGMVTRDTFSQLFAPLLPELRARPSPQAPPALPTTAARRGGGAVGAGEAACMPPTAARSCGGYGGGGVAAGGWVRSGGGCAGYAPPPGSVRYSPRSCGSPLGSTGSSDLESHLGPSRRPWRAGQGGQEKIRKAPEDAILNDPVFADLHRKLLNMRLS